MRRKKDIYTRNLFEKESKLRIIHITKDDIKQNSDNFIALYEQIIKHETLYPDIQSWLNEKVRPGIINNSRVAYLGLEDEKPVVSAILKKGIKSKICHLNISQKEQDKHLGELFFIMMILDAKRNAEEVHFTLPESLWWAKKDFFMSFGFDNAIKSPSQYRKSENELRCSIPFLNIWERAMEKLPKIISTFTHTNENIFSGILMSIKPDHVEKMQSGEKIIEIRKRFNKKWKGCRMTVYSSRPDQAIYGYAKIEDIIKETPDKIWEKYEDNIGVEKNLFDEYTNSCEEVYAIFLKDFESYHNPVYLSQIEWLLNSQVIKPPQSYLSLETNTDWSKAVSVAELLHKRFWVHQINI